MDNYIVTRRMPCYLAKHLIYQRTREGFVNFRSFEKIVYIVALTLVIDANAAPIQQGSENQILHRVADLVCCKRRVKCDGGRRWCPAYYKRQYCLKVDEGQVDMKLCTYKFH